MRRMKLPTREMGEVQLLVTWAREGKWEPEIEPLRGTRLGDQFSVIKQTDLDHALMGLSRPLVDALGIPPAGALLKLPPAAKQCAHRSKCPFYEPAHCHPGAARMPWCFEPEGIEDDGVRQAAAQVIGEWRQGVHVVIVEEEASNGR